MDVVPADVRSVMRALGGVRRATLERAAPSGLVMPIGWAELVAVRI